MLKASNPCASISDSAAATTRFLFNPSADGAAAAGPSRLAVFVRLALGGRFERIGQRLTRSKRRIQRRPVWEQPCTGRLYSVQDNVRRTGDDDVTPLGVHPVEVAPDPDADLADAVRVYAARNPASRDRFAQASRVMPGGNTRSVLYFPPFPLCMMRGAGCRLWDADDHCYVDMLAEFTAGIYGHSDPTVRAAIDAALDDGINLSGHNHLAAELARVVCERFPSIDLIRFATSGTEATLMALAAAKAFTGRRKILVFEGGYHGGFLAFPPGGSRVNAPHAFVIAPYNNIDATLRLIGEAGDDLAAILVEPMLGGGGCVPAEPGFFGMVRTRTKKRGPILIFREGMTKRALPGGPP